MTASSTGTEPIPIVIDHALATVNNDLPLFKTVVQLVLDQIGAEMPVMRADVALKNSAALAASSHRLKGSLGAISALPAHQACCELNRLARIGAVDSYVPGLARTEQEINRLIAYLRTWLAGDDNEGLDHAESQFHQ